jgi:ribose transport system permease protein
LVRQLIQIAIAREYAFLPLKGLSRPACRKQYKENGFAVKISDLLIARMIATRDLGVVIAAMAMFLTFSIAVPRFASAQNVLAIVREVSLLCIVSVGMTFLLIAGEFDLSVGANYGFLLTCIAFLTVLHGVDPMAAGGMVIILGAAVGIVNGFLVTKVKLKSFIATLGSMAILRGAANIISGGYPLSVRDESQNFYLWIGGHWLWRLPNVSLAMAVVLIVGGVLLAKTRLGSSIYATGGDTEAAFCNGINTTRVKLICFAITGGLCGLIATLMFGWIGMAPYNAGNGFELKAIAAAVVGGTGLFGGRGTIFGMFVGALLLEMLTNGLILMGVRQFWDGIAAGVLILCVASLDLLVRRSAVLMAQRFTA